MSSYPFAEQLGLLRHFDSRTLRLAVGLLRKHPRLSLSVNVSSITASDQEWLATLQELTACERAVTERLVLEITETNVIDDIDQARSVRRRIARDGVSRRNR